MFRRLLAIGVSLALLGSVKVAFAQQGHEEHGKPAEFKMPANYKDAVREIQYRLHEIEELMESKQLDNVHKQADVIKKIGEQIGQLALKADSGVPKDGVKDVNTAGKGLASKFDAIDKAGDSGDAAATKKVYDEMVALAVPLRKYAQLGEHGGPMLAASDKKQYFEVALASDGDLHVYAYDDRLKGLMADKVKLTATAGPRGAKDSEFKPVTLAADASKSCMAGKVDAALKAPCTVRVTVASAQGGKPETLEFAVDSSTEEEDEHAEMSSEHPSKVAAGAATTFYCPMKCEGAKTYPAAGKCPKCGMALKQKA